MRNRHHRRLCLLLSALVVAIAGTGLGTLPSATAAPTTGWRNFQCEYNEAGTGSGSFVVDGAVMLWQEAPTTIPNPFRLDGVNRSSNGRLATQTVDGPKGLKAFVISTETRTDATSNREYESVLEVITPKPILGGCTQLPFNYSARYVSGILPGDTLNVRNAPSIQGKVLTVVEPSGFLWITGKSSKSWVSVAVVSFPGGQRAAAEIIEGWANGRYLSAR
jgi:hypothetical protein